MGKLTEWRCSIGQRTTLSLGKEPWEAGIVRSRQEAAERHGERASSRQGGKCLGGQDRDHTAEATSELDGRGFPLG